jgi:NTE family protein
MTAGSTEAIRQPYQDALLERHLRNYLGDVEPAAAAALRACLTWLEVAAGATVMTEGEPGDALYLVVSGRLRAYVNDDDGRRRAVREMGRGQIVGEMGVITGEPRRATVVTVRDSLLVRLDKDDFNRLAPSSPRFSALLTRQIIAHLQSREDLFQAERPVTLALVPVSAGVDAAAFAQRLAAQLARFGHVRTMDAPALDADLGEAGVARREQADAPAARRIAFRLGAIEADHDVLLLVADDTPTPWTERCCRGADEILLLADAAQAPALHPTEARFLAEHGSRTEAAQVLLLLHDAGVACPRDTRGWLARRPLSDHVHVRPDVDSDMARLARIESHTAVGLVFAGGGARGLAHLGIYRALRERGIEADYVGGTSIGAIMAALVASDRSVADVTQIARRAFARNPTRDFNLVPLLSLIKGRRLRRMIDNAFGRLVGFDPDVEDLWKNCFCIASNYTQARESVIRSGNLGKALRASLAIPGALPPVVHQGDLLCDGGTFNNFPVDVMRHQRGVGTVIGVDLGNHKARRVEHEEVPGTLALLRDRLRPRARRHYRFPSLLAYLMNVQILYSTSRQQHKRRLTDVYFNPPLERVGLLQWERFDEIVAQGHAHGLEVLAALEPALLERVRAQHRAPDGEAAALAQAAD